MNRMTRLVALGLLLGVGASLGTMSGVAARTSTRARTVQVFAAASLFDVFSDIRKMLLGQDQSTTCIWNGCDPYTTRAVQGVESHGQRSNCGRTNKDGIDFVKADREGFERELAARYGSFELVGSQKTTVDHATRTVFFLEGADELMQRCDELRAKYPGISWVSWTVEMINARTRIW